jgi:translocation and assembly module TamB
VKRRRLIAIVSAFSLLTLGLLVVGLVVVATRTQTGQAKVAVYIRNYLTPRCRCEIHIGKVSGNFLNGVTLHDVRITDKLRSELFFRARRITASYDPRDIWDNRIYIRRLKIEQPYVHMRQYQTGLWNWKWIFKVDQKKTGPKRITPGFGDFVVVDSVQVIGAEFDMAMTWRPDSALSRRARDSVIAYQLSRTDRMIRRDGDAGFLRTYQWRNAYAFLSHVVLAEPSDPDSTPEYKQLLVIDKLHADESDPPFKFRNVQGTVRVKDTVARLDIAHFDLPGSVGSAKGRVEWGGNRPNRYNIEVRGDSVALNDVAWVYPTLPRTGGGKMNLTIKTDPTDDRVIDFRLTQMDVRTTKSRLTGAMTFAVGGPIMGVKGVDLVAGPVDFDLLRALSTSPWAIDWQGGLFGTVKGRGGPLDRFQVDALNIEWRDTRVPGAVSTFRGAGGVDLVSPALAKFHDFRLDVGSLDLRSIERLFPAFPRLNGTISGSASLDSIWTDVRFRNADLTHTDGPGEPSRVTGSGRVTTGRVMSYDVELEGNRISFDMLRNSYPTLPFQGTMSGPIRASGTASDLALNTALTAAGGAGSFSFDGRVDIDSLGGYGAQGRGEIVDLDLRRLLISRGVKPTSLQGHYDVDLKGSSSADATGKLLVDLGRSRFDSLWTDRTHANLEIGDGRAKTIDSLRIASSLGVFTGWGGLGLPGLGGRADTLAFDVSDISLDPLRAYLPSFTSEDSLGAASLAIRPGATISGKMDSLRLRGTVTGSRVAAGSMRAKALDIVFDVDDALEAPRDSIVARADSLSLGGVRFRTAAARIMIADSAHGTFTVDASNAARPDVLALGRWSRVDDERGGSGTFIHVDTGTVKLPRSTWTLAGPSTLFMDSTVRRLDSLVLRTAAGGFLKVSGAVPTNGPASVVADGEMIPLSDIGALLQFRGDIAGSARLHGSATGTRLRPRIDFATTIDDVRANIADVADSVSIDRAELGATYDGTKFVTLAQLTHRGRKVGEMKANIPAAVTLFSAKIGTDTLSGLIKADSAEFALFKPFMAGITPVAGTVQGELNIGGRWGQPSFTGSVDLRDGQARIDSLGIALHDLRGRARLARDSIVIERLTAESGEKVDNVARLEGTMRRLFFENRFNPILDLTLTTTNFLVLNDRTLAQVAMTTDSPLVLTGPLYGATIGGEITLPRAKIFLPDPATASKRTAELDNLFALTTRLDTGAKTRPAIIDTLIYNINVRPPFPVHMGEDVRLVSLDATEADVKLSGDLNVITHRTDDVSDPALPKVYRRLGLTGTLIPVSGTYTLNLGILRKQFTVQREGSIFFDGNLNPRLNVSARTTVRPVGRQEVIPIIVELSGRLDRPEVRLRSDARYAISESDLASYLLTNQPAFALGQQRQEALQAVLTTTTSTFLSGQLRRALRLDALELEGAPVDFAAGTRQGFTDFLSGTRITGEKQIGERVFVSAGVGLCSLFGDNIGIASLGEGVGLSVRYTLKDAQLDTLAPTLLRPRKSSNSIRAAREPSTNALYCSRGSLGLSGLAPTPQSWSLSFLNTIRWP